MIRDQWCRSLGQAVRSVGLLLLAVAPPAGAQMDPQQVYRQLKDLERQFEQTYPLPPAVSRSVGSFDAATRQFTGLKTESRRGPPEPGRPTLPTRIRARLDVNAVNVALVFEVSNSQGPIWARCVTVEGSQDGSPVVQDQRVDAASGALSVTVDVGQAQTVAWEIWSGMASYRDTLTIVRPFVLGVGAFTIPVMPVAILYAPPPGQQAKNVAVYRSTKTVGNSFTTTYHSENSTSKNFSTDTWKNLAQTGANLLDKVLGGDQLLGPAMRVILGGLGSYSSQSITGTSLTDETGTSLVVSQSSQYATPEGKGPGVGDRFLFLKNAKMMWLGGSFGVRMALLGADNNAPVALTAEEIGQRLASGTLDAGEQEGYQALLKLDPFLGRQGVGRGSRLADPRYGYIKTVQGGETGSLGEPFSVTYSEISRGSMARTSFTTTIKDYNPGWIAQLFFDSGSPRTVKSTISSGATLGTVAGQEVVNELRLWRREGEWNSIDIYYDNVFGTLAFEETPNNLMGDVISGLTQADTTVPIDRKLVTLVQGARRVQAYTDARGRFALRGSGMRPGSAQIQVGALPVRTITIAAGGVHDLVVTLPGTVGGHLRLPTAPSSGGPDVAVLPENLNYSPAMPVAGSSVILRARILNLGRVAAQRVQVRYGLAGAAPTETTIEIAARDSGWVETRTTLPSGTAWQFGVVAKVAGDLNPANDSTAVPIGRRRIVSRLPRRP